MEISTEKTLSIIIPVYNEEDCLAELYKRLIDALSTITEDYEVIFVNDGSTDRSLEILKNFAAKEYRVKIINLSRNFGHQPALTAGLSKVKGDLVVLMDGDLQDPPEVISDLVNSWKQGNQVVIAKRRQRAESGWRRLAFDAFYRILGFLSDHPIPLNAGIFGLLDKQVVGTIKGFSERNRFLPGLRSWVGFRQGVVYYDRVARHAGEPKQTLWKLCRYGLDAIFSFSYKPLRLSLILGFTIFLCTSFYSFLLLFFRIIGFNVVRGFTTTAIAILILGGIQLFSIGVLGEYLGRIYDEVKRRPYFIIDEMINVDDKTIDNNSSRK